MKTNGLTFTDRIGLFYGMVAFFFMLPLTLFMGSIPTVIISNAISNRVVALTVNLGILGIGTVVTFLVAMLIGLATSHGLSWVGKKLRVQQTVAEIVKSDRPIEACRKANYGALIGAVLAMVMFLSSGSVPIHSVTTRVEHLFPGPLVLSLGNLFSFDLSHVYAAATGFLAVGFLFAIVGIVFGSLVTAVIEMALSRQH